MVQNEKSSARAHRPGPRQLFDWVEDRLRPAFDSPPVGTYDAAETTGLSSCPVCGRPMTEHTIEHSAHDTVLNCPVPHPGAWDRDAFEPVNEFGMVMRERSDEERTSGAGGESP
ncbi:hypothetical protein [Cryobacterium sp. PAMC25264]|uniref:hypothetical protein n=1 Tax=Cryobacterium sp. PAMC25264 TaxID=2861288 RepID=UPI001C633FF3|nr:hypothetical protein [Cryobacterium sp. PAMC25264]QYF74853.1 hypothetical protein KY500_06850 [Cryobacterium sp. PAMC25264]